MHILERVRESKFSSVIADEVTDTANMESLSLVLHYLDPASGEITEDLMEFAECAMGISG